MFKRGKVADAIRREMAAGRWRAGEPLPSVGTLRERFGVGEWTVRAALHDLRDAGLVTIAKHVGTVVTDKVAFAWKGHVVFAHSSVSGSYYAHRFACQIASRLESAGWMTHQVFLSPSKGDVTDTTPLERHLAGGMDLAVVLSESWRFSSLFDRAGVPYVVVGAGARDFPNARAVIVPDTSDCFAALIGAMKAKRLRNLVEIDFERRMDRSFKLQLSAAGINVHRLMCLCGSEPGRRSLDDVAAAGRRVTAEFLANPKNRAHLPDAILFDDDYLATGGILAILEAGLRIPEDIRCIARSNKGNAPASEPAIARIENDPVSDADSVAEYALAVLAGRRAVPPRLRPRFVLGGGL